MTTGPAQDDPSAGNRADGGNAEPQVIDDPIPAPQPGPPYSADFLAHRRGGMYEDLPEHAQLWQQVRTDPDAVHVLTALDEVTAQLEELRRGQ